MDEYGDLGEGIVRTAVRLLDKGYLMATGGNLSMRVPGRDAFAITPSDYDYRAMGPEDICVLSFGLEPIRAPRKPSVESGLHAAVYRLRADVNAVVHTHQVYAGAVALIRASMPALFDEQARFLGRTVEVVRYAPSGTGLLASAVSRRLRSGANAYILANHGALCLGPDLERAANNVEILEKCSLAYLLALCTERRVYRIPVAIREIALSRLRADQKRAGRGGERGER